MKNLKILLVAGVILNLPGSANAQGIPVYDGASWAQTAIELQEMAKDYQKQIEQLESMTGARNAGALSNGVFEQQLKQYLPNSWEETMDMINAGTLPSLSLIHI